jgi:hypothetical protein
VADNPATTTRARPASIRRQCARLGPASAPGGFATGRSSRWRERNSR